MDQLFDFSGLSPEQRRKQMSLLFDSLAQGNGIVIRSDDSHSELLEMLQTYRPGAFEWRPLLDGPDEWRTLVTRRREGPASLRNIMEFMTADHKRIHNLLDRLINLASAGQWEELAIHLAYLETGLRKHFQIEEELLFPVITARMGTPRGPAAVLRDEHIHCLEMIQTMLQLSRDRASDQRVIELARQLQSLLISHSGIEERILYAFTDLLLADKERDELVKRSQRL